jgi:pyruvate formate lyase activating enzyme
MGRFKWKALGLEYRLEDTQPPSAESVERTCEAFRARGLVAY